MSDHKKPVLGHIECPTCQGPMRVTNDKNGHPFGYCEADCGQQLRVGPDRYRVEKFRARYQWARPAAEPGQAVRHPVPVTVPAPKAEPKPEPKAEQARPVSAFAHAVQMLAGSK